jgi:hypothetical protein
LQILATKIGDFVSKCASLFGGEALSARNRRRAIVDAQNRKTLASQPPANLVAPTTQVDHALMFWEPAGLDRSNNFLLRLVCLPKGTKIRIEPAALPSVPVPQVRPFWE